MARYTGTTDESETVRSSWKCLVLLILGLMVLAGPRLAVLHTHILGFEETDSYGTQWFYWVVAEALVEGRFSLNTSLLHFPVGLDLLAPTGGNLLDAVAALPFRLIFGPTLGYNLFVLGMLGLSTWLIRAFVLELHPTDRPLERLGATSIGLICAAAPHLLLELHQGRPTQALIPLLIGAVHSCYRVTRHEGWRPVCVAGLLLALLGYQYWFYALFVGLSVGGLAAWSTWTTRSAHQLKRLAAVGGLAVLLCLPGILPMVQAMETDSLRGMLDLEPWSLTRVDLRTMEGEAPGMTLWQPLAGGAGYLEPHPEGIRWTPARASLTWSLLVLALVGLRRKDRDSGQLMSMILPVLVLAMGPVMVLGTVYLGNPVYQGLTQIIPVLSRLLWPERALALLLVLLSPLAMAGLLRLGRSRPRRLGALIGASLVLWAGQLRGADLVPFHAWRADALPVYQCLSSGPEGAVIQLPSRWSEDQLYYQTHHGRPIIEGMGLDRDSFVPEAQQAWIDENAFLGSLLELTSTRELPEVELAQLQELRDHGFRWLVLRKDPFNYEEEGSSKRPDPREQHLEDIERALSRAFGEPVFDDARSALFDLVDQESPCANTPPQPMTEATTWSPRISPAPPRVLRPLL